MKDVIMVFSVVAILVLGVLGMLFAAQAQCFEHTSVEWHSTNPLWCLKSR